MTKLQIRTEQDLRTVLAKEYMKAIENFFGDPQLAREFLSNVVAATQRNPKLLECTPETLLNSFVTMASLKLMPSGVSGEAFVLPYKNKGVMEAQFQLGYQGLVTLFYRAGVRSIVAEIVRENDTFDYVNGEVHHRPDVFSDDRGKAIGAYVVVELQTGGKVSKVMSRKEILSIGEKFSKSFGSDFGPWKEGNDPELWMWKKTVLKQAAKLVPKNETIYRALAEDNKDSVITERKEDASNFQLAAPVTADDLSSYRLSLQSCTTLPALERVWADIPGDARTALKSDMEGVKAMIMSGGAEATIV
jgi:recombination protein RecT